MRTRIKKALAAVAAVALTAVAAYLRGKAG